MSEEKTQQPTTENPKENIVDGDKPATGSIIDRADTIAKRLEEANKKTEELLGRQEAVAARMMLAGRADAGMPMKTPQQEALEKAQAEAKAIADQFKHK